MECLEIRRKRSLLRLMFSLNNKDENLFEIKNHMELLCMLLEVYNYVDVT